MTKKWRQVIDELNAAKAKMRSEEILVHGKEICYTNVVRNRKRYTRKRKHKNKEENEI